jgi:dipeptidyl aminopeptidase/acylaminoacyl peptidase
MSRFSLRLLSPRLDLVAPAWAGASAGAAAILFGVLLTVVPGAASAGPAARAGVLVYSSVRDLTVGEWGTPGEPGKPDGFADLFIVRADGTGFRRLTRTTWWEQDPAWSPDRKLIAYSRGIPHCHANSCEWGPMAASVWVMTADGRRRRPLTHGAENLAFFDEHPTWSPDSKKVAFTRNSNDDDDPDSDPPDGIYAVGVDGRGLARISRAHALSLAWSPGGSTIAFVHESGRYVGLLDVATGRASRLRARGLWWPQSVAWSPRGRFLAVATGTAVYIVRTAGGVARKIVEA